MQLRPIYFLIAALIGFHFSGTDSFLQGFTTVGCLGLLGYSVWYWLARKKSSFQATGYELVFVTMLAAVGFSAVDAYLTTAAWADWLNWVASILLFYVLSIGITRRKDIELLRNWLFAGLLLFCVIGLYQYFATVFHCYIPFLRYLTDAPRGLPRISSLFIHRSGTNVFAAYLALIAPIYVSYVVQVVRHGRWSEKAWQMFGAGLVCMTIALTLSRALLVSLVVGMLFFAVQTRYWKQYVIGTISILIAAVLFVTPVQKTIYSLFDTNDSSNSDHWNSFRYAWELIGQHPLNGWGGGHLKARLQYKNNQWVDVSKTYKTEADGKEFYPEQFYDQTTQAAKDGVIIMHSPHNYFLGVLIEYGALGVIAFYMLFVTMFKKIRRVIAAAPTQRIKAMAMGQQVGMYSFMVYCLFQDSLKAPLMAGFFWVFLLLTAKEEQFLCRD
jgi:O-antigen ligase